MNNIADNNLIRNHLLKYIDRIDIIDIKKIWSEKIMTVDELSDFYKKIDEEVLLVKEKNKVKFICKKGCCDCCNDYFKISKLEYELIERHLHENEVDIEKYIIKSINLQEKLKESYPLEYKNLLSDNLYLYFTNSEKIDKFSDCIFLENGLCKIYPVRPIVCRLYGITRNVQANGIAQGCDKIIKKCSSFFASKFKVQKYLQSTVELKPLVEYKNGLDYEVIDGKTKIYKPYPIFYYLAQKQNNSQQEEV